MKLKVLLFLLHLFERKRVLVTESPDVSSHGETSGLITMRVQSDRDGKWGEFCGSKFYLKNLFRA